MLSGTITGSCDNSHYSLTCEWSCTQSIANNTSTITAKVYLNGNGYTTDSSYWSCVINGVTVTINKDAVIGGKTLLGQKTWTVTHASSGTCSTTISFSYSNGLTSAGTYTTKKGSGSGTITLNTIPRTSSFALSKSSMDMGASQTVTISRASSSFTHTIQYTFGGTTTTTHTKTTSTSVSFTPPVSLATKIPNATSGTCTVKVTTYNGSTAIGSATKTFTLTVPSNIKPSAPSISLTCNGGLNGLSIAGKSTITATASASGSQGSTISSYTWSGSGLSGTGSSKTTGTLNAGSYTITVTVKDSRGRTNTASKSFTVYAYSSPTCSISAYRCNSDGTANSSGTYVRLKLNWALSNPNSVNTNKKTYQVYWKKSTDSSWTLYREDSLSGYTGSTTDWDAGGGWVTTTSYNIKFTVTDSFGSTSATCTLSTINALLNLEQNGVGVGKIYERGKLDVGGAIYTNSTFNSTNGARTMTLGAGSGADVYIKNSVSGGILRLEDSGILSYNYNPILTGTMTSSGNRWGVWTNIGGDGVMEVGKYIDFHASDTTTSDYNTRIYSEGGNLVCSGAFFPNGQHSARMGYNSTDACMFISNANGNWLRLNDDGTITWRGYNVLTSNGTQRISGNLHTGSYKDSYQGMTMRRYVSGIGNYMGKIGCSTIGGTEKTVTIEVGGISDTSTDEFNLDRRYSFGLNYFLVHTDNTVNIGSSSYRFKAVHATNGTIQTSDGRYKYILENITSEKCYNLIRDMNLYGYSTLNKRIDEYVDTTEISDELQQSSREDMNLHMGFVAQDIEDSELAKYILIKDELENEDGKPTGEHIYSIDNYAYSTAIHGALQHEIELREKLEKEIEDLKQQIKSLKE